MSEMVESTITSHTYVAHVPVPSQKEVTSTCYKCVSDGYVVRDSMATEFSHLVLLDCPLQ